MPYRKMMLIFDRDGKRYFAGWNGQAPLWSDDIHSAYAYTRQNQADDDYEILKELGFNVKVQGEG